MPEFIKIATIDEILPGQAKMVEVNGNEIAVFNIGGSFHAIDNDCTHVGGPLCEGEIEGIDVTTGRVLGPPAVEAVNRHSVRVEGSDIQLEI